MKTPNKKTRNLNDNIFSSLKEFEQSIKKKPPIEVMIKEIAMMGVKIKTVIGDFSSVNFSNKKMIEVLWSLGKFDDFFQKKIKNLNKNEQEILLRYFDHLKEKLVFSIPPHQTLKFEQPVKNSLTNIFEIEILRPSTEAKKIN